ncbi:MmgE/PrpD family protein [Bacillus sp. DJP31]|uniref:MmgE/PrpD family protein n=1 Tax=Bacillus sp. DJP31 TaxID=3409789 RepID=UPI003BB71AAE
MKGNKSNSLKNLTKTICNTSYEDVPTAHFDQIKLSILDSLGVALMAKNTQDYKKIHEFYCSLGGGSSYVWGSNKKVSSLDATFLNIYAGHRNDFDNILYGTFGHPSVILYPALISVYDYMEISGERLLKSILIGLETMTTLGMSFGWSLKEKGFHPTSVLGGFAIASSLGWMLEYPDEKLRNAFGLVGASISGFKSSFGTLSKPYQVAVSGREALSATLLLHNGAELISEGKWLENLSLLSGVYENDWNYRGFGEPWILDEMNFLYKFYPCCGYFHHVMMEVSKILENTNEDREFVEKVHLILPEFIKNASMFDEPNNIDEAKFSILFNLALVLIYEDLTLELFTEREVQNPTVKRVMEKIEIKYIKDEDALNDKNQINGWVRLEYKSGQVLTGTIKLTDNGSEVDFNRIYEKFYQCARSSLTVKQIDKYVDYIMNIEKKDSQEWIRLQENFF